MGALLLRQFRRLRAARHEGHLAITHPNDRRAPTHHRLTVPVLESELCLSMTHTPVAAPPRLATYQ